MLEDARRDDGVKETVGKGESERVRERETSLFPAPTPLPLSERRGVNAPGLETEIGQQVDCDAVAAAAVEHACLTAAESSGDQRSIEPLDSRPGPLEFVLQSEHVVGWQLLLLTELVVIRAAAKVGDPLFDGEILLA
ncbi:MAG TPA: hypothetical protein VKE50_06400 [Thermoanaerobaculia bacterium]|nr:hypothetical protein [Thermoanaerobaculia bacterium]